MDNQFEDRTQAGEQLAESLKDYAGRDDVIVLALPRGGVPVGHAIAQALNVPLDVLTVRKLGVPGQQELAFGAIASGGSRVLNRDVVVTGRIDDNTIEKVAERERRELQRRESAYRGDRPFPSLENKTVILVDDGIATGATMRAAVEGLRQLSPARVVIAVPVAPPRTCHELESRADDVICLMTPEGFGGVGRWYNRFDQTTDEDVKALLGVTT